jgi:hypothetical protein
MSLSLMLLLGINFRGLTIVNIGHRWFLILYERALQDECNLKGTLPYVLNQPLDESVQHITWLTCTRFLACVRSRYWNWTLDYQNITQSPIWSSDPIVSNYRCWLESCTVEELLLIIFWGHMVQFIVCVLKSLRSDWVWFKRVVSSEIFLLSQHLSLCWPLRLPTGFLALAPIPTIWVITLHSSSCVSCPLLHGLIWWNTCIPSFLDAGVVTDGAFARFPIYYPDRLMLQRNFQLKAPWAVE